MVSIIFFYASQEKKKNTNQKYWNTFKTGKRSELITDLLMLHLARNFIITFISNFFLETRAPSMF